MFEKDGQIIHWRPLPTPGVDAPFWEILDAALQIGYFVNVQTDASLGGIWCYSDDLSIPGEYLTVNVKSNLSQNRIFFLFVINLKHSNLKKDNLSTTNLTDTRERFHGSSELETERNWEDGCTRHLTIWTSGYLSTDVWVCTHWVYPDLTRCISTTLITYWLVFHYSPCKLLISLPRLYSVFLCGSGFIRVSECEMLESGIVGLYQ